MENNQNDGFAYIIISGEVASVPKNFTSKKGAELYSFSVKKGYSYISVSCMPSTLNEIYLTVGDRVTVQGKPSVGINEAKNGKAYGKQDVFANCVTKISQDKEIKPEPTQEDHSNIASDDIPF